MGTINDREASLLVGGIVLAMVVLHLWRSRRTTDEEERSFGFAATIGVLAGFTTLIANAAGPLMAIYLLAMRLPKMQYMGTAAVFFLIINSFKVPFMMNLDLINRQSVTGNLILVPAVFVGAFVGRRILTKIDQKLFESLALWLSALAGLKLLF